MNGCEKTWSEARVRKKHFDNVSIYLEVVVWPGAL